MEDKFKKLIEYAGFNPDELADKSDDDLKEMFDTTFLRRSEAKNDDKLVNEIVGKHLGEINTSVNRAAKNFGLELDSKELEAMKTKDRVNFIAEKMKEVYDSETSKLNSLVNSKGEEAEKQWSEKYTQLESKYKDTLPLIDSLKKEVDESKKNAHETIKNFQINDAWTKAMSKVPFKEGITELERVGFETMFKNKYKIDVDENNAPYVADKTTGSRIPNKAVSGTFMGIEDVLAQEVEVNNLGKKNPHASNNPVRPQQNNFMFPQNNGDDQPKRKLHPNAQKATEK